MLSVPKLHPIYGKQKSFNSTFYGRERVDVVTIQPHLIRDVPEEFQPPIERDYFAANGFTSDDSFADLPVEANWGLFSIGDSLIRHGCRVSHLDFNLYDYVKRVNMGESITHGDIADSIKSKTAKVFAISCMTASVNNGIQIAKIVKMVHRNAVVVLGGIHPSLYAEELLREHPDVIDIVVKGEGEISFVKLLEQLKNGVDQSEWPAIPGICYTVSGRVVVNQPQPLDLKNEDSTLNFSFWPCDIPFTPRINLSRGCVGNCTYCSANRSMNSVYRLRTVENIINDIESSVFLGYRKILFGDLSFGCYKKIAMEVCQYIIDKGIDIQWWCQMRLTDCETELLEIMARAGCKQIALGFESAETEILDAVSANKKDPRVSRSPYDICKEINNLGIALQGYFIIGLPDETMESAIKTIEYMESLLEYNMTYVHISVCVPFPGTDMYEHPEKYNIEIVDHNFDNYLMNSDLNGVALPVFNGAYLSRHQVHALWSYALATAHKHLSKRGRAPLDNGYNNIICERFYPRLVV